MRMVHGMGITADTTDVLEILHKNRDQHRSIVKEARVGYMAAAEKELKARLKELRSGKIVSLSFTLRPPQDYTNVYEVAIRTLQLHKEPTIKLTGEQVRNLIMDEWEWTHQFLLSNAAFSGEAVRYAATKGLSD